MDSKKKFNNFERNLQKTKQTEVSLSAFTFLFSEMVQYSQKKVKGIQELEKRLSDLGYMVGLRCIELTSWRDKPQKRDLKLINLLQFIHTNLWLYLFNKKSDALERSTENEDEYMISDNDPTLTKFMGVPKEMSSFHCGQFVAGIIEAACDCSGFEAKVSAHSTAMENCPTRVTFLLKFSAKVMAREKAMS